MTLGLPLLYSFILHLILYTSLVTKLYIDPLIRLTYFMANIKKEPSRCVINFKES